MDPALAPWRARSDLTLEELVAASSAVLVELAPHQPRWAVNERPDARTIRYYTTRGMLPKPLSYDGGRARYGFGHLVRLLAIKHLQAQRLTLDQIARALDAKSDDDVLGLVKPAASTSTALVPLLLEQQQRPRADEAADLVLDLAPGGRVVVDAAVVRDPEARARLAENLEHLARWLRATNDGGTP